MMSEPTAVLTEPTRVLAEPPTGATLDPAHPPLVPPGRSMFDVLVRGRLTGVLLQDLAKIPSSIPWLRSQRYWANAGVNVFVSGDVPYGVTNGGEASRKAVEMYLASLRAAEQSGCREASSYVLELGTGMGLFAKLFLDQLRALSKRDYERTTYIVADYSKGLLEDTRKTGVFAAHEERVRRVHLPTRDWRAALATALPEAMGAIRAIHGNYLLDSLPFTILSYFDGRLFELRIRTRLRADLLRPGMTPPPTTDALEVESWLADVLESVPEAANTALEFEAEYVPVEPASLPLPEMIPDVRSDLAMDSTPNASMQFLHGYGAIEFLKEALGALRADGYFVAMDYDLECPRSGPIDFQTYGSSVAAGANFAQLVAFAKAHPDCQVGVPPEEPSTLQARCFARDGVPTEIIRAFEAIYSKEAAERREAPLRFAAECVRDSRHEAARASFAEAYQLQPFNWVLLEQIGSFVANTLQEYDAALEIARRALLLNHLSPTLWNLVGDCHFNMGDMAAAELGYREAVRLRPSDPRGVANLAWVFQKKGDNAEALRLIGQALALDAFGDFREELLHKQKEAMVARVIASQRNRSHSLHRRSGHYALPGRTPAGPSSNGAPAGRH
jgi:tetratricopeptide (TPR) repeat protein